MWCSIITGESGCVMHFRNGCYWVAACSSTFACRLPSTFFNRAINPLQSQDTLHFSPKHSLRLPNHSRSFVSSLQPFKSRLDTRVYLFLILPQLYILLSDYREIGMIWGVVWNCRKLILDEKMREKQVVAAEKLTWLLRPSESGIRNFIRCSDLGSHRYTPSVLAASTILSYAKRWSLSRRVFCELMHSLKDLLCLQTFFVIHCHRWLLK